MRKHGVSQTGFTLIELVIVIAVIAVLAAILVPVVMNQADRAREAAERSSIDELARAMRRFKTETGEWPFEKGMWTRQYNIDPTEFTNNDMALFVKPGSADFGGTELPHCTEKMNEPDQPCWGGPYLNGAGQNNLGATTMYDQWNNKRMVTMIRAYDGFSEGTPSAPAGAVLVWSRGPDGIDQTGCYSGACTKDVAKLARGESSSTPSDDIVKLLGQAN